MREWLDLEDLVPVESGAGAGGGGGGGIGSDAEDFEGGEEF